MTGREWTLAEDMTMIGCWADGWGWEERAHEQLDRTRAEIVAHAPELHLHTSDWMLAQMRREGMTQRDYAEGW